MPHEFSITNDEILFTEKILLPEGKHFDDERRQFINNLETIDLQAVPGSGKTTALLAKLLILDKHLPFSNGSGILVISHTNAAVNEIKDKIFKHCRNLFTYPNFVGTIQSFVDEYLAIPHYINMYKKKPVRIDDEIYLERHYIPTGARAWLNNQANSQEILNESRLFGVDELKYGFSTRVFPLRDKTSGTYQAILQLKKQIRDKGILSFDDAYILAFEYIEKFVNVRKLLQDRFQYIFVDEMQDMESQQCNLLEKIFFNNGNSHSKYQRIGDKNQAIFSSEIIIEDVWVDRSVVLELNGSHRLNANVANTVQPFSHRQINIIGLHENVDGTRVDIKPHLIIYNNETKEEVIPKFAEIIKSFQENGRISTDLKNKYKAIGWSTKKEDGRIRVCDYHPSFSKDVQKPKIDYNTLDDYLSFFNLNDKTLSSIRINIFNSFLMILRLEGILNGEERFYTKHTLLKFLQEDHTEILENFNLQLYQWCIGIIKGNKDIVINNIRLYIPVFLRLFEIEINESRNFIEGTNEESMQELSNHSADLALNIYMDGELEIEVTTIHSVKGQTHTATLYLETFYSRGNGNYESERLANQIMGVQFNPLTQTQKVVKQATKMVYVGFSRPTHLLCLAVHQDHYASHLSQLTNEKWEIISIN